MLRAPGLSLLESGILSAAMCRVTITEATSANRITAENTHRHESASTSHPPANGPAAVDTADHAAHCPIAAPRSSPANAMSSIARLFGTSNAPAAPCTTRSATRGISPGASAHPAEAIAKATHPIANTRARPKRSPSAPPSSISALRVRRYPLMTHCNPMTPT